MSHLTFLLRHGQPLHSALARLDSTQCKKTSDKSKILNSDSLCYINSFSDISSTPPTHQTHMHTPPLVEITFGMIHVGTQRHNTLNINVCLDSNLSLPFILSPQLCGGKGCQVEHVSLPVQPGQSPHWWQSLLLQQSQLLQGLPSVFTGDTFWGDLDTDTWGPRKFVTALSLVGQVLGALLLLQVSQLAYLDTCKVFPRAQGGWAGPRITQDAGRDLVQEGALSQRSAGFGAGVFLS